MEAIRSTTDHFQEKVYGRLRNLVLGSEFRPGAHLRIPDLAHMLGVSPTPIREALQRLYKESLITMTPHRGFYNRVPSLSETKDLFEMLQVCLEAAIGARQSSPVASIEAFSNGHDTVHKQRELMARVAVVEARLRWIACLANNAVLSRTVDNLIDRTHLIRCLDLELDAVFNDHMRAFDQVWQARTLNNIEEAQLILRSLYCSLQSRLTALVKEALLRMYDS